MRARNKLNFCSTLRSSPTASSLDGVRSWQLQRGFQSSGTVSPRSCVTYGWSWRRSSALPAQDADHCRPKLDKLKKRLSLIRPHTRRLQGFQFEAAGSKVWMPAAKHLQVQSHRALPTLDPKSKGFGSASANSASRQAINATEPEMLPRDIFVKSSENLTSPEETASVCRLLPLLPD